MDRAFQIQLAMRTLQDAVVHLTTSAEVALAEFTTTAGQDVIQDRASFLNEVRSQLERSTVGALDELAVELDTFAESQNIQLNIPDIEGDAIAERMSPMGVLRDPRK